MVGRIWYTREDNGLFLKGKSRGIAKKRKKNERKRARNDFEKLGLHVGDSFQDTREIREVLDKSVFREEEPTHSQQAEVLENRLQWRHQRKLVMPSQKQ